MPSFAKLLFTQHFAGWYLLWKFYKVQKGRTLGGRTLSTPPLPPPKVDPERGKSRILLDSPLPVWPASQPVHVYVVCMYPSITAGRWDGRKSVYSSHDVKPYCLPIIIPLTQALLQNHPLLPHGSTIHIQCISEEHRVHVPTDNRLGCQDHQRRGRNGGRRRHGCG